MKFELDHFFVLTEPGAPMAERLITAGLQEGKPNTHRGQGTSNRRFFFTNSMLELLWLRDREEALAGPGMRMKIAERVADVDACPFGLVFRPADESEIELPFDGWKYEPDYLDPPNFLHIGANSHNLVEPLLVFAPFLASNKTPTRDKINGSVTGVRISSPVTEPTAELSRASDAHDFDLICGGPHLLEAHCEGSVTTPLDMRPELPLVIHGQ